MAYYPPLNNVANPQLPGRQQLPGRHQFPGLPGAPPSLDISGLTPWTDPYDQSQNMNQMRPMTKETRRQNRQYRRRDQRAGNLRELYERDPDRAMRKMSRQAQRRGLPPVQLGLGTSRGMPAQGMPTGPFRSWDEMNAAGLSWQEMKEEDERNFPPGPYARQTVERPWQRQQRIERDGYDVAGAFQRGNPRNSFSNIRAGGPDYSLMGPNSGGY